MRGGFAAQQRNSLRGNGPAGPFLLFHVAQRGHAESPKKKYARVTPRVFRVLRDTCAQYTSCYRHFAARSRIARNIPDRTDINS